MAEGIIKILDWLWNTLQSYLFFWVILKDYEGGVILTLGRYNRTLKKGWNWKVPLVEESVTTLVKPETVNLGSITVTTVDNVTCTVGIILEYEIVDTRLFLLEMNDAATNLHDLCRGWAVDVLTDATWAECNKKPILTKIKNKLKESADEMGVKIRKILYGDIVKSRALSLFNNGSTSKLEIKQ